MLVAAVASGSLHAGLATRAGGLGLRISHQLCSFVVLHHGPGGFTIRMIVGDLAC